MDSGAAHVVGRSISRRIGELLDPNFVRSVVLLIRHSDEGAMGLVINRPTKTTVAEAWKQVSEAPCPTER